MIKRLLVADQYADNFLKTTKGDSPCCGDGLEICEYVITSYTQSNTVSLLNITEEGVARALPCVPATTSAADVKAAILAALIAAGYEDSTDGPTGVVVVDNGSTLSVTITGDVVPISLTTSGGAATFTALCDSVSLCTFTLEDYAGGATNTLRINGVDYSLGAITPGTTTAGDVDTAIGADMATAGVLGSSATTTEGSGGSTTYNIIITGTEQENTFTLNDAYLVRSACAQDYVA